MEALHTSIILAILCTSFLCVIDSQSPKTRDRHSKAKIPNSPAKGAKCGISARAPSDSRIIGGFEAIPHSWPWQVSFSCSGRHYCGGSIISDKWIITAAHCLNPARFNIRRDCRILLGKHNLKRNESSQLFAKIADYSNHEKFKLKNIENGYDLALIKLAKPLKFTDAIQPICLPFGLPELPVNKSCIAIGWGYTKSVSATTSDRLMQLPMTARDEEFCTHKQNPIGRIICTTSWDLKKDICYGDSGGPLACQEDDGKWYLRGALSYGPGNWALWAVFTKVTSFEKWIKTKTLL